MKRKISVGLASAGALSLMMAVATPASAAITQYSATLSNAGEPVSGSPGSGTALVTLDDVLSNVTVHVTFQDLTANASAGHIHCCTTVPGAGSIGVAQGFAGFPAAKSGTYDQTFTLAAASFTSLATGIAAGKAYVNIHSPGTFSAGEVRGFLAPVPEPETYALMLAGMGVLGLAARRRRG